MKSYHIKTAALWLCQDTPREEWKDPINAMHMILDELEEAATDGTLYCFFWTKINLLAEFRRRRLGRHEATHWEDAEKHAGGGNGLA